MKKEILKITLILISFCFSHYVKAQVFTGDAASAIVKGTTLVKINEQRKTVDFVKPARHNNVTEQNHLNWLSTQVLRQKAGNFVLSKTETDKLGYKHYHYNQFYQNIKVEYSCYKAHIKNSVLESANGEWYDNIIVNTMASVPKESAFNAAVKYMGALVFKNDIKINLNKSKTEGELVILPKDNSFFLTYKFDLYSEQPLKRAYIYVDAHSGKVISEQNRIVDGNAIGTAVTGFSGTQTITTDSLSPTSFRLNETSRGNGINTLNLNNGTNYGSATNFTDTDNFWNSGTLDKYAYDAHFGAQKTYDFYFNTFGRNSYDGLGTSINSYVHYSTSYVNAFWDGTQMTYGDGDGIDYYPLTSMEIVGHEITHAVTETSAGLIYSGESGALNESFSDIFGNTIRFISKPTSTWFIGDEILRPGGTGVPFRNMANPNQFDCADTYGGTFWNNGDVVHFDSGVQNFWFYLLSTGGSGVNDNGDSYAITGIGLNDAAAIAFRNLTVYLSPSSNFADARFYAIQAATDLFGSCSNQVIQTTNAWYAVGVGGLFSNAVVSAFNTNNNYYCVLPATVNFINNSINATSYSWNFGDGGTSTLTAPSHTYTTAGTYTVTLIASGAALCGNTDTLIQTNYITVTNGGGPVTNSCSPSTVSYCCNAGITNFQFGTINKTSPDASEGYKDFTCGTSTTLTAGNPVPITVTTSFTLNENVKCYIDYNNNGIFDPVTELVFTSLNKTGQHTGIVHTPITATLNTPLRLRVMDDNATNTAFGPCTNLSDGQAEDYTITFIANTLPPVVDFIASDTVINVGSTVNFSDLTINAPTGWQWSFPGGAPSSSTLQNPTVIYNTLGTYPVTLVATNSFGTDSLTKTMYIHVVSSINMCSGITVTTAPNGQFYDSGGPSGPYQNGENCSLLIDPGCAISITLSFSQFASESGFDYLRVYNGTNATSPLLLTANGSSLPPTVTATSGKMFITWDSDGSVTRNGWNAQWTSVVGPGTPPVAAFTTSTNNPPLASPVQFTDQTTNLPISWSWDFGDGQVSILQNPLHSYATSGTKTITLIATNCISSDTISQTINVQQAPVISTNPDSIVVSLACTDSITIPVTVYNTGIGDLIYNVSTIGNGNQADTAVLVIQDMMAWGLDMSSYLQTNFGITPTVINSAQISSTNFSLYDIIVTCGAQSTSYYSQISANKPQFENFVNSGGILHYQLAQMTGSSNTMLAGGATMVYGNLQNTNIGLLLAHPILNGISNPLNGNSANHCTLTNLPVGAQIISETNTGNFPTTVEYNVGSGYVVATGMTWEYLFVNSYNSGLMLTNCFNYHFSNLGSGWLSTTTGTDTVAAGDSSVFYVTINSSDLVAGNYNGYVFVSSNDPLQPVDTIPVSLTVSGPAEIALSDTCLNFGNVMQFTSGLDTITINNTGCDSLHITSATSNNSAFNISPSVLNIAAGSSAQIAVSFNPQTVGAFNATLTLLNNSQDTTICLTGSSFQAPIIAHAPASLSASLAACGDSVTIPFNVYNIGGDSLNFVIGGSNSSNTKNVLAFLYGVDLGTEYPTLIGGINQYFTNYTLDTTFTTSPTALQSLLSGKDVLLMPEQETGSTLPNSAFATVVQNFVSNGGTVIICGSQYAGSENRLYDYGLFTGNYQNFITGSATLTVSDTTDDLMDGIPLSFQSVNATFHHNLTSIDKTELVSYNGNDVVTYREIGSGKVIYLGFDYFATNASANRIAANAIRFAGSGSLPVWLSVTPSSGDLASGDTTTLYVTFNSTGMAGGTYNSYILIYSNDPLHPVDSLPVTMNVGYNPCADFGFSLPNACSGIINFVDSTLNNPTSWQWNFGDGGSSVLQNPTHTYSAAGTYSIQLIVCNATACDTVSKQVVITSVNGPVNASCSPITTAFCCGMGITQVVLNTINKTSQNAVEGYKDFTCTNSTNLTVGNLYTLTVTTGTQFNENVRAWIDFNNNGVFNTPTEQVFASNNILVTHTGSITIPLTGIVLNTPLRMRISSDWSSNNPPSPCSNLQYGQAEDYTVVIQANTIPPDANFTKTIVNTCTGIVQFTDASLNFPTSWYWEFGDGATSNLQNPLHQYSSAGTFNVKLIASNAFGTDSTLQTVTVNVLNAGFAVTGLLQQGQSLQFTPITTNATTYLWNFGDGFLSTLQAPQHTYAAPGIYYVTLQITSGPCTVNSYDTLTILPVGIDDIEGLVYVLVSPNPFSNETQISYSLTEAKTVRIIVTDLRGRVVRAILNTQRQHAGKYVYKFDEKVAGTYLLNFEMDGFKKVYRIVKTE